MDIYIIGQIIGFIFLIIFIISFQFKEKKKLMRLRILSNIISSIHYFMIGAFIGSISEIIYIIPNYFSYKYENSSQNIKNMMIISFSIIYAILGLLLYKNMYDFLPIIGCILTIIAIFIKGTKYIRLSQYIISPIFLIYNIINLSYAGIILEILVLISVTIGYIRLDKNK